MTSAVEVPVGPHHVSAGQVEASTQETLHQNQVWAQEASQAFLESAPDAVVVIDSTGRVILVNAQTETMFGHSRDRLIGQPVEVLLPRRFREAHRGHRADYVIAPGTRAMGAGHELFGLRADGTEFPIDISLSTLETSGGLLYAAAVRDVSERRRDEARFGSFLESAPDAVVLVDSTGSIALVNAQTERLFGYRREAMVGQPVEMLLPQRFRDAHTHHRDGYVSEPHTRAMGAGLELFGLRADGTEFPIDISLAPLDGGEGRLSAATVRDVTERKRLEAVRDQFIHLAAHELRTPLATLAALGETLALRMSEMSPENVAEALGALKRQGERASTLIANLLDLSRLEGGHTDIQMGPVDVALTMQRVLEGAPAPDGTTVTVDLDDGYVVVSDPVEFDRLLTNLLTNAYRYGGNRVRVTAQPIDDDVVMTFSDNGDGVPADLFDTMFDPFVRGRAAGTVGGSGLGLALCRRLVDMCGGSIWYDTDAPGATFKVRLRRHR